MTEPNPATRLNVQLSDFLVASLPMGRDISVLPIKELKDDQILASDGKGSSSAEQYENAIILKQDGTYLLGKNIADSIRNCLIRR